MTDEPVLAAYSARSAEYIALLGSVDQMHELDQQRIGRWADGVRGPILDAGCGPGHWTAFLSSRGLPVEGIDLVPEFLDSARARFPGVTFRSGSLRRLDAADGSLSGVLAWYSLIHLAPDELPAVLAELARVLRPGGSLLAGFFDGTPAEAFPHQVTTAYFWSADAMAVLLEHAGFEVGDVESRQEPGTRPLASMTARTR